MQPFDYRLAVQNPVQMALAGYQQGQQFKTQQVQAERETQLYDMQMQQYQAGQQEIARQQARAKEMQGAMAALAEKVGSGQATAKDFFEFNAAFPEAPEQFTESYKDLTNEQKEGSAKQLGRTTIAILRAPDVAMSILEKDLAAARNSGLTDAAAGIEAMMEIAKIAPEAAATSGFAALSNLLKPDQFEAFMSVAQPQNKETEAFQTLQLRAAAAGLRPDTPEYQEFMKQGGVERGPLVDLTIGETVKTGALAPETALVEDPNAPGGLRIIPLEGGTAESVKETAIATADDVIKTLNELKSAPGAKNRYGLSSLGGFVPAVPGSPEANAQAVIDKVKGAAFLQAFETLKGGGQITQVEGEKATAAITVLQDQNISWEFAVKAANDLIAIVEAAKARKAKGETAAPATGTTTTPTRRRFDAQGREIR